MLVEVEQKTKSNIEEKQITTPKNVYDLQEIQEIKGAIQEHLIYLGLDRGNNIRHIKLLGLGNSASVHIDSKDIIRTALINADERVILVHNHPSNKLEASSHDIHLSNVTSKLLKVFNIELLDHIIVTEREFLSMKKAVEIDKEYVNDDLYNMDKGFLLEENKRLKKENEDLQEKLNEYNCENEDDMEM